MKISLSCISELAEKMKDCLAGVTDCKEKIRTSLRVYRDWCFERPKVAVLVFSKLEENIGDEDIMNFYICNRMGENLLAECRDNVSTKK